MTWKDVKLATLQKMFSADGTNINMSDETVAEYVNAMPFACNEALALLAGSNKYYRLSYEANEKVIPVRQLRSFYSFGETIEAYSLDEEGVPSPIECKLMADRLILPTTPAIVYYNAWPEPVSANTKDTYSFPLTQDVVVLLPLYMAAELYKDDDIQVATVYRNEFEAARAELYSRPGHMQNQFYSKSGW